MPDCPQLAFAVEKGDVEAPNAHMVEALRKAKWPPQRQATECERGPDWSPRKILHKPNPNALKGTGTCKPEGELAVLKSAARGNLEGKTPHNEGEPSWEDLQTHRDLISSSVLIAFRSDGLALSGCRRWQSCVQRPTPRGRLGWPLGSSGAGPSPLLSKLSRFPTCLCLVCLMYIDSIW